MTAERGEPAQAALLLARVAGLVEAIGGDLTGPDAYLYRRADEATRRALSPPPTD